jgi:hypothetical protein
MSMSELTVPPLLWSACQTPKKFQVGHTQADPAWSQWKFTSPSICVILCKRAAPVFQAVSCDPREQTPRDSPFGVTFQQQALWMRSSPSRWGVTFDPSLGWVKRGSPTMTLHCPFLLHPCFLSEPSSPPTYFRLAEVPFPSFWLAMSSYKRKKMGWENPDFVKNPTRLPDCTPDHSGWTFIWKNQIAAATAAAEINGIWQEKLLFFQS